jgi:hypothetical protein
MAENKMEAVAQLFGKRLGEEFTVESWNKKFRVTFTVLGIDVLGYDSHLALELGHTLLISLLTGMAVIVNEV